MQKIKSLFASENVVLSFVLALIGGVVYLIFVPKFGYFNDDWYLMYAAGTKGPSVFWDVFAIDRPLRALVMIPAYSLFGANPLYYNLSAFLFRLLSGLFFLWILRMLWPGNHRTTLWMSLLFLLYPGFLSQPNAIDYLCHMAGLAAGMLSIALTLRAIQTDTWTGKIWFYLASILLGWFYLGQIEWYIGLEFFRFACILVLVLRLNETLWKKAVRFVQVSLPAALIPIVFLVWRLFFFESERGATDVDLQLTDLRAEPLKFLINYSSALLNDFMDVLVQAWWLPLRRLSVGFNSQQWLSGFGIAALVLLLSWIFFRVGQKPEETESGIRSSWRREAVWIGVGAIIVGLLPVILVGRSVDFKNFSRYTLIASVGAALLWPLALSYVSNVRLRNILFGILLVSASLTHYANGFVKARETKATRNFWWQVSWRAPQINPGATLVTHYSVAAEEDYFTWGPANLLYHPESNHEKYVQPAVYAVVLNEDTVAQVLAREPQDYSNRRSIRTYPNYRNILILSQPTPASCVQVIDLHQVELSSSEDSRVVEIATFSEAEHIALNEPFRAPPAIPFGAEPPHTWCYFFEKASYARQVGDWDEVLRLGEEAISQGYFAKDKIEWMPFLQAYASAGDTARLKKIASFMTSDLPALQQACHMLTAMPLDPAADSEITRLFCAR
ncbi:MAG: hypothetical protein HYZ21_09495 [Chloroflexi bacterium]|nr:hypothetical protein [Chloroflexota bacterium]